MTDLSSPPGLIPVAPAGACRSDALLECLLVVARAHGRPLGRDAAVAGLPLEDQRLTPGLFARAAKRAGLSANVVQRPLSALNPALFPAVVLLAERGACVLLGWAEDGSARVIFPELPEAEVRVPLGDLAGRYAGSAIYARPVFRFDARSPEVGRVRHRHWFWGVLAENRPLYRDVLLAAALINLLALALPLFTMNVYDRVVPNQATDTLWMLALGVVIVVVADVSLRTMRGYFLDLAGSRVDVRLSAHIMERVLGLRLEDRPVSAGSFAANLRSFETVRDFITSATVTALVDLPFALLFLVVVAWIGWPLVFPILLGMAAVVIYGLSVQGKMHDLAETTYRAGAQRNATLIESLVGLETVKALGLEGLMQARWEKSAAFLARVSAQLRLLSSSALNGAAGIQQLVNVLVVVLGVYLIGERMLSMGGLIACTMLAGRAMAPLGQITGLLTQYHGAATALESLDAIMARPVERPVEAAFVNRASFRGEIEFKDVTFQYPGQDSNALRGVSFRIAAGEKVAVLGRIGSGKTTLQKLILSLYQPTGGAVLIDGVDLRQLDPAELRRAIGYVPQDITLFFGSLKDNLTIAAPQADDAAILQAARVGAIDEFVNAHPRGFDMLVGERGESLSGGQRQGVAIARAVINDPPILLLDEPTGSMDHSSEEEVKRRLAACAEGKTLLVITHRTSLLELVDRIIVVDGGRIVADGPKVQVVEALRQGRIGRAA